MIACPHCRLGTGPVEARLAGGWVVRRRCASCGEAFLTRFVEIVVSALCAPGAPGYPFRAHRTMAEVIRAEARADTHREIPR